MLEDGQTYSFLNGEKFADTVNIIPGSSGFAETMRMVFRNITPGRIIIPIDFTTAYIRWQNGLIIESSYFFTKGMINFIFEGVFIY